MCFHCVMFCCQVVGGTEWYFNDVLVYFTSYVIITDILL